MVKQIKKNENEEDFADLKESNKKVVIKKIVNIALWVILFILIAFCVTDFILVKTDNKPVFCAFNKVKEFEDGKVSSCYGLGYKVINYNRESMSGLVFSPVWKKVK
ncbi:MAG: hypothetical protein GX265_00920 [Mollicutes bacterium]|jgi:Trk-type K+ transport system membrane component|nr:hypothetical protein [Mollicutes bacterium]